MHIEVVLLVVLALELHLDVEVLLRLVAHRHDLRQDEPLFLVLL